MLLPSGDDLENASPKSRGDRIFLFIFVFLVAGLMLAEVFADISPQRLAIPWFGLFWIGLTILHEAGHAVVARMVGWRVDAVRLGFGPVVSRPVIMGMDVEVRMFPIVGLVEITPTSLASPRLKNALVYAAGPVIELLAAAILTGMVGWDTMTSPTESYAIAAAQAFGLAAVVGAGLNLIPFSPQPGAVTDGLGILMSPFLPDAHFETLMIRPLIVEGERLLNAGEPRHAIRCFDKALERFPEMVILHAGIARAQVDLERGDYALSEFQAFMKTLEGPALTEAEAVLAQLREYIRYSRV